MYQTILYEEKEAVALITINRIPQGNAFSAETYDEISEALKRVDEDDAIKAAIITGAGKFFCAGGDVEVFQEIFASGRHIREEDVLMTGRMVRSVKQNSKPVIAAVNGIAAGAGLGLALACDFVVMGESSKLFTAFINMALPGDTALMYTLQAAIGTFRTTKHMMLNEPIDASLAQTYGLAHAVVADEQIVERAMELAQQLGQQSAQALAYQKDMLSELFYPEIDHFNELEAKYMHQSSRSDDHLAAVQAFLSKKVK